MIFGRTEVWTFKSSFLDSRTWYFPENPACQVIMVVKFSATRASTHSLYSGTPSQARLPAKEDPQKVGRTLCETPVTSVGETITYTLNAGDQMKTNFILRKEERKLGTFLRGRQKIKATIPNCSQHANQREVSIYLPECN